MDFSFLSSNWIPAAATPRASLVHSFHSSLSSVVAAKMFFRVIMWQSVMKKKNPQICANEQTLKLKPHIDIKVVSAWLKEMVLLVGSDAATAIRLHLTEQRQQINHFLGPSRHVTEATAVNRYHVCPDQTWLKVQRWLSSWFHVLSTPGCQDTTCPVPLREMNGALTSGPALPVWCWPREPPLHHPPTHHWLRQATSVSAGCRHHIALTRTQAADRMLNKDALCCTSNNFLGTKEEAYTECYNLLTNLLLLVCYSRVSSFFFIGFKGSICFFLSCWRVLQPRGKRCDCQLLFSYVKHHIVCTVCQLWCLG